MKAAHQGSQEKYLFGHRDIFLDSLDEHAPPNMSNHHLPPGAAFTNMV